MTDVSRALTRLAELLDLAHVQAGAGKPPACKQLHMVDFWIRVSEDLPMEDSELPGGSHVYGAAGLTRGMIKRINLAMIDKRRSGSQLPLDIEGAVLEYERAAVGPAVDKARLTAMSRAVMQEGEPRGLPKVEQTDRQRKRAERRKAYRDRIRGDRLLRLLRPNRCQRNSAPSSRASPKLLMQRRCS